MKQEITSYLDTIKDDIFDIVDYINRNPEESFYEHNCCNYLTSLLRKYNFNIKNNFLNMETSFYANLGEGHPKICYLCHYDALKGKNDIKGYNIVSAISCGAAIGLSKVISKTGGSIIIIGCPGEYASGSKVTMVKQGVFDDIDVVLSAHPDIVTSENGSSIAVLPLKVKFTPLVDKNNCGHYSPLDASTFSLSALSFLIKGLCNSCTINNLVSTGSLNSSEITFSITSTKALNINKIEKKIRNLISSIGDMMNIHAEVIISNMPFKEMITNETLSRLFMHNLKESGIIDFHEMKNSTSEISMGYISHVVPTIYPSISIVDTSEKFNYPSIEFSELTTSFFAKQQLLKTCKALSFTALDLLEREDLLKEIKLELCNHLKGNVACENK